MKTRRTGRERFTELLFYAVVILVAYLAMQVVWPFLGPLAWAVILAVTLRPVYLQFCIRLAAAMPRWRRRCSRRCSSIAPAAFLAAVVARQVPLAVDYVNNLFGHHAQQVMEGGTRSAPGCRCHYRPIPMMHLLSDGARAAASFLAGQAGSLLANVLATVGSLLVMLFALFFLLRDGTAFAEVVRRLLPFPEAESQRLINVTSILVVASVGAGLTVAAVQGFIGGIAFWALGLPAPAVWASQVAMAITSLLPVICAPPSCGCRWRCGCSCRARSPAPSSSA